MDQNVDYTKIGHDIIGAAFDVRNQLGRLLREEFYRDALAYEIQQRGYYVETEHKIPVFYKNHWFDKYYYADIVVNDQVIIEVKASLVMKEDTWRQLYSYLRLSNIKLGYLINFGAAIFHSGQVRDEIPPYKWGFYRLVNGL